MEFGRGVFADTLPMLMIRPPGGDSGVVDHDVDPAMCLHDLGEQRVHIGFLGHIGGRRLGRPALAADLGDDAVQHLLAAGDQHGLGALGGEVLGDGLADAGAGTGDDGDAVLKLFHGRLSNAVSRRCRSSRSGTRAKSSWSSRPRSRSAAATSIQNEVTRLLISQDFLPTSGTNRRFRRTLRNKGFFTASGTTDRAHASRAPLPPRPTRVRLPCGPPLYRSL